MATKKAAKKKTAAKKTTTQAATKKVAGMIVDLEPDCQPCTWGFEMNVDAEFKRRNYKVAVSKMKDASGKEAKWPDGRPVLKIAISPE
jgi:hypothetical protein